MDSLNHRFYCVVYLLVVPWCAFSLSFMKTLSYKSSSPVLPIVNRIWAEVTDTSCPSCTFHSFLVLNSLERSPAYNRVLSPQRWRLGPEGMAEEQHGRNLGPGIISWGTELLILPPWPTYHKAVKWKRKNPLPPLSHCLVGSACYNS